MPTDLVGHVGRSIEKQSLRTKDVSEARVRFSKSMAELAERWSNLRAGLVRPTYEQHLVGLEQIGADEERPAVHQLDMRDL
ncbi:DUF6538 domain-containing protein [Fulvimarina manganoxydans]|uniref:DUF6538 domain-containing protein n=1 Tax=Fulvimarina manganoxydans TaxID=937218 RepID=UPI0030811772